MKTSIRIISLLVLAASLVSCNNVAEYKHEAFVTLPNDKLTVKETASELKVPVNLYSQNPTRTTVTYTISTEGEKNPAVAGEDKDYIIKGTQGVLNLSNVPGEVSDSIVIKPVSYPGEIQGNKSFVITLATVTDDGVSMGATSKCKVTIIDVDGGLNLLVGTWVGTNLASNGDAAELSFNIDQVEGNEEGLEDYKDANVKILAGSTAKDPSTNPWEIQVDLFAYYDDETNQLQIYPQQIFAGGNFGETYGVLYVAFDVAATLSGAPTPVCFSILESEMSLVDDTYFALYNESGSYIGNCGKIKAGATLRKVE